MDILQRLVASALRGRRHHLSHRLTRHERRITPDLGLERTAVIIAIVGVALDLHGLRRILLLLLHGCLGRLRLGGGLGLHGDLDLRVWLGGYRRGRCLLCPGLLGLVRLLGLLGLLGLMRLMRLLCGCGLLGLVCLLVWLMSLRVSLVADVMGLLR